ncbi:MAG TPA: VOC family protein, partial [Bryobacteraceae bacterium]|nr:VOC family protein [Bryobacteraceae bacterium]
GVSTLGITLLFTRKTPSGPSAGSAIDHLAFKVPDLGPFVDKLAKTPYKSFHPPASPPASHDKPMEDTLMVDGPDGVRIELIEDNTMYASLEFNHIHLYSTQSKDMQAWYLNNLGGRPGAAENPDSLLLPGAPLTFTQAASVLPSADRAIDHLSFEVKGLDALCQNLTENGVKLDSAPHSVPELKASVAVLTDPWGTRIELLEKAAR